jgi:ribosome biogenesis GTPase
LLNQAGIDFCHELIEMYESIGYRGSLISVLDEEGILELTGLLKDKTTLIAGHSGVGKSTLLNILVPGQVQKTGEVSTYANKGTHTTTFAEMFEMDDLTKIIDTPGIKELGLVDMQATEISHYFPEMRAYLGQCKFNNCLHTNEPGCQVLEALEAGTIEVSRYHSYLSILEDYDNRR